MTSGMLARVILFVLALFVLFGLVFWIFGNKWAEWHQIGGAVALLLMFLFLLFGPLIHSAMLEEERKRR